MIEHFDDDEPIVPRLGRFPLVGVEMKLEDVLKVLGIPLMLSPFLIPEVAAATVPIMAKGFENVDPWLMGVKANPIITAAQSLININKDIIKFFYSNCNNLGVSLVTYALIWQNLLLLPKL